MTRACSIGLPSRASALIVAFGQMRPDSIRPVSRRPRCGSRSRVVASITNGAGGIDPGRRDMAADQLEQRRHALIARAVRALARPALPGRGEEGRKIELLIARAECCEQIEHLVVHGVRPLVGPVDLVDHDDRAKAQPQRLAEHELGLRHRPLGGVDQEQDAVDHREDALDLAAEVGVARRVDDVDPRAAPDHRGALGEDRDAALALEVVGIEGALDQLLAGAEGAALLQQTVDQGRLAVVDVGDDGDVAQIHGRRPRKSGPIARAAMPWI